MEQTTDKIDAIRINLLRYAADKLDSKDLSRSFAVNAMLDSIQKMEEFYHGLYVGWYGDNGSSNEIYWKSVKHADAVRSKALAGTSFEHLR